MKKILILLLFSGVLNAQDALQPALQNYFNGLCCTKTPSGTAPTINYAKSTFLFTQGNSVNECPTLTGDPTIVVTVSPSLPAGLSLNSSTGCITGTPTSSQSSTSYTFTATNSFGSSTDNVDIVVSQATVLGKITITGGGFANAAAAEAYLQVFSTTYTNFSYDAGSDVARWDEPAGTIYGNPFMNTPDVLATAVFSDTQGHIVELFGFKDLTSNHTFVNGLTFTQPSFELNSGNNTFGNNTEISAVSFNGATGNNTFGDNCTFGATCFGGTTGNNTFGINAFFADNCFPFTMGIYNFGNGVTFDKSSNDHFVSAVGATANFGNIADMLNNARLFGSSNDCIINFNGNIGATSGADIADTAWVLPTATNLTINARISDQTSNGGGIEGDLANLINNGATVNFILP